MSAEDIRWIQRNKHFIQAYEQLRRAQMLAGERALSDLEEQGLIQAFEYTHELAWNTLKDFLESKGGGNLYGSKDTTREAFRLGLIEDGETWMEMIKSRDLTSHTYNLQIAKSIVNAILARYCGEFEGLCRRLERLREGVEA